jgi:hypothetical protein
MAVLVGFPGIQLFQLVFVPLPPLHPGIQTVIRSKSCMLKVDIKSINDIDRQPYQDFFGRS